MTYIHLFFERLKKLKPGTIIIVITGVMVFLYIAEKSSVASFTHDESFSYNHYVSQSFLDILSNKGAYTNNHILNTLGVKYSEMLFGSSEFALRLPNLLLFLVFLIYTVLLLKRLNPVISCCIFIVLATNSVLMDFFGLARGYGMSIGFMTMSLYHLITSFEHKRDKNLVLFNLAGLLAILSSFTMLTYYVAALLVYNIIRFAETHFNRNVKFNFITANRTNLLCLIPIILILYEPIRRAIKFNTLNFGGKQGFISDSVTSIVYNILPGMQLNALQLFCMKMIIILVLWGSFALILLNTLKSLKNFLDQNRSWIIVNMIFLIIGAETILQFDLLKTDYLIGRFALFLLPLFVLNLGYLLDFLSHGKGRCFFISILVVAAILSGLHFYRNRNFTDCSEWGYDSETKNAVLALIADQKKDPIQGHKVKVGINWLFEPTMNFYKSTKKLSWLTPLDRIGLTGGDDYAYIFLADTNTVTRKNYRIVFKSDRIKTQLIRFR